MKNYKDLNDYEIMYMVEENNDEASSLIYEKYKPIIQSIARKKYKNNKNLGLELEDFIQEGYYGLYSAIKNYNPNNNNLFYTYAVISINSKINNLIYTNTNYKNKALNDSISLYKELDDDGFLIDFIEDKKALLPDVELVNKENISKIKNFIYSLPLLEASILELYYNNFKYKEIASLLHLSIRKVEYILDKIRKNKVEKMSW